MMRRLLPYTPLLLALTLCAAVQALLLYIGVRTGMRFTEYKIFLPFSQLPKIGNRLPDVTLPLPVGAVFIPLNALLLMGMAWRTVKQEMLRAAHRIRLTWEGRHIVAGAHPALLLCGVYVIATLFIPLLTHPGIATVGWLLAEPEAAFVLSEIVGGAAVLITGLVLSWLAGRKS